MGNQSFIRAIDKAAEMCGNSVKLAQRLGVGKSQVSEYRSGKRSVPKHVIEKLAELIDVKAEILWIWAQDMRNPLREGAAKRWLVQTGGGTRKDQGGSERRNAAGAKRDRRKVRKPAKAGFFHEIHENRSPRGMPRGMLAKALIPRGRPRERGHPSRRQGPGLSP